MSNIILIGFMGCGKTSVGIRLSYRLRRTMIDTDKQIEREQRKSISEIFEKEGESAFRDMETSYLKKLLESADNQIISVGGGLPLREENRKLLEQLGDVFYLRATPECIYERLKKDTTRPLLQGENPQKKIATLMCQRSDIYEQTAKYIVDVDQKDFEQIMKEVLLLEGMENQDENTGD